jgi:hypothetical protein
MFINLSNHPSDRWSEEQRKAALELSQRLGAHIGQASTINDIPFPNINPYADRAAIEEIADQYFGQIYSQSTPATTAVHVMGEMTCTFAIIRRLLAHGYSCVAATSERNTIENPDGTKLTTFNFVQFRSY